MSAIATRLLLSYLAVIAVGLLAAGAAITGLLVRYQDEITRVRLQEIAAPLLTAVQQGVRAGRPTRDVVQTLTEQARAANIRVLIVGSGQVRRIVVDSEGSLEGQTLPAPPVDGVVGTFRQGSDEWIFVQRAMGPAGVAVIARPKAVFADTLGTLVPALLAGALVAFGFSLLVALLFAGTITRPLRHLVRTVRRFAAGRYRERAAIGGPREVRELGGAFNDMAEEIERARGSEHAFLADISHELRTPLTSIQGFAQAIVEEEVKDDGTKWAARLIQRESRRLVRMVEGLLQVARLEAGAQHMARERIEVGTLLDGAIAALAVQAKEANVAFQRNFPPAPPVVGDPDRLAQLFLNVLDNAVKHSPPGSTVRVAAAKEDGEIVVRVTDEGSGLPGGAETRLFERFYRGENAARNGAGLGLAIAQAIAQAHGGRIEAANAGNGRGAEFRVRLPVG